MAKLVTFGAATVEAAPPPEAVTAEVVEPTTTPPREELHATMSEDNTIPIITRMINARGTATHCPIADHKSTNAPISASIGVPDSRFVIGQ
jgi:hypothetical protein